MKVSLIQNYSNQKQRIPLPDSTPQEFKEKTSAGLYGKENNTGYNVTFSGGLPGKSGAAAKSLGDRILGSKAFDKILTMAEESPIVCNSLFALGLAGILRPATLVAMSGKKDKEDNIYASSHAVSSGIIGFISSIILTTPLNKMVDRIKNADNPEQYLKEKTVQLLGLDKTKDAKVVKSIMNKGKLFKNMQNLVKVGSGIILGVPQAMITIALIPPILKYVFGIEKKPKGTPAPAMAQSEMANFQKTMHMQKSFQDFRGGMNVNNSHPAFTGNPVQTGEELVATVASKSKLFDPVQRLWDSFIGWGAKHIIAPFLDFKPIRWFADKTKDSKGMVNHLNAASSAAISGMYITKTLDNDKLDKDRKNTLAINQALVFVASTAGSYLLDGSLNNIWNNKVTPKYAGIFLNEKEKMAEFIKQNKEIMKFNKTAGKDAKKALLKLDDYIKDVVKPDALKSDALNIRLKGLDTAKKLFIFATVYRYLAPIIVTPIANRLGDKYLNYKKAKEQRAAAQTLQAEKYIPLNTAAQTKVNNAA